MATNCQRKQNDVNIVCSFFSNLNKEFDKEENIVTREDLNHVIANAFVMPNKTKNIYLKKDADTYFTQYAKQKMFIDDYEELDHNILYKWLFERQNVILTAVNQSSFPNGNDGSIADVVLSIKITDMDAKKIYIECEGNKWFDVDVSDQKEIKFDDPIIICGIFYNKINIIGAKSYDITFLSLGDENFRKKLMQGNKTILWKYYKDHDPVCLYRGTYLNHNARNYIF